MKCAICGNINNNELFSVKEMNFGYKTAFSYFECSSCGCLQLMDVPEDLSKYYPSNYYSFKNDNFLKKFLKRKWIEYLIFKNSFIGKFVSTKFQKTFFDEISKLNLTKETHVLDVGSGSGDLIVALNGMGFKKAIGIDPFIENNKYTYILKKTIQQMDYSEKFDLILFDHSFEHIPEQWNTLKLVLKLLSENGTCMIAIPLKNDYIWNLFGVNWVQIDAPRHLFLHTIKSFTILTEKCGLEIQDIIFDSNEFLFCGSEQYKNDISLMAENSYLINLKESIFSKEQVENFKLEAKKLNNDKLGDQAIFVIKKA